jgi:thiol-disulfide isomerase/thioredoxin
MNRRRWLGAAALAAAAGLAIRLVREPESDPPAGLWDRSFPVPGGGTLEMASLRGRPLLLNFWGTWCPPCVREMPELDRFAQQFKPDGWQVLGLAVDNESAVKDFLLRQPVSYPIALAGFGGIELSRRLGNSQGSLPFTALFDRSGSLRRIHLGETRLADLAAWAGGL